MKLLSTHDVDQVSAAGADQIIVGAAAGAVYGTFAAGPVGFVVGLVFGGIGGGIGWAIYPS